MLRLRRLLLAQRPPKNGNPFEPQQNINPGFKWTQAQYEQGKRNTQDFMQAEHHQMEYDDRGRPIRSGTAHEHSIHRTPEEIADWEKQHLNEAKDRISNPESQKVMKMGSEARRFFEENPSVKFRVPALIILIGFVYVNVAEYFKS